jgi:ribonuclease BN (tRNA processing enzyme)
MKLHLRGTSGYHPTERRQTACFLLPEAGIVLDAGTGFFRVRPRLQTRSLDILLTHAHLDHVVGLTYLLGAIVRQPLDRVTVHARAETLAAVRTHLLDPRLFPAPLPCDWQPLPAGPLPLGTARVTHFPLEHPGGCVGYRLDWPDRSLAYVTDTTASLDAPYVPLLAGVDLLVHECNFRDDQAAWAAKTGHSATTPVAQVAAAAGVKRLVLVHFDAQSEAADPIDLPAARRVFAATELGYDGMEIDF